MKCDACGIESDFEEAFFKERKSFRKSIRTLCPACRIRRRKTSAVWFLVLMFSFGVIGYAVLWFEPSSFMGIFLTSLFLIDVFLVLAIVPHELGHAIVGRLLGWRVFVVSVGIGKQILKFRLSGTIFVFNVLPIGGLTQSAPEDARWYRTKRFLMVLAGPAVNAAIAAVILSIWWVPWHEVGFYWGLPRPARLCVWANLLVVVHNLWPHRTKSGIDSDGAQLIKTFSKKNEDAEKSIAGRFVLESALYRDEDKDLKRAQDWCDKGLYLCFQRILIYCT